jgi:hypothetical protein
MFFVKFWVFCYNLVLANNPRKNILFRSKS